MIRMSAESIRPLLRPVPLTLSSFYLCCPCGHCTLTDSRQPTADTLLHSLFADSHIKMDHLRLVFIFFFLHSIERSVTMGRLRSDSERFLIFHSFVLWDWNLVDLYISLSPSSLVASVERKYKFPNICIYLSIG